MGTCIICGTATDGHICGGHEQDVYFEFRGTAPEELTVDRFYRGTVDGFADFGVFVDIGDDVTGLLHTSELDRRLESLDWEPGDTVYVQVKNVRENGNVDLGWSIRQHASEFRGKLIETPGGDELPEGDDGGEGDAGTDASAEPGPATGAGSGEAAGAVTTGSETAGASEAGTEADAGDAGTADIGAGGDVGTSLERTEIDSLADHVGATVRIEGEVVDVRQTSGPTVFEVRDETGAVECAAFESAGVRAYPEVDTGDLVRLHGEVEERRGDLQIETETLAALEDEEREAVERRLDEALADRARPESTALLAGPPAVEAIRDDLVDAATSIRRAVFEGRPIVIRHGATVDGYLAGAALERAAVPLIEAEHDESDAAYHYVERRPLEGRIYGMGDATRDTTRMIDAGERHGEPTPLFVFVGTGGTEESRDGLDLLSAYDAGRIVIDDGHPDGTMADAADAFVAPDDGVTATALCANVAAMVNGDVRDDLRHLPAASYWHGAPEAYVDLAADAGYDAEATTRLREAVAIKAFYQSYEDKRELIADLLFGDGDVATHASERFRERVDAEIRTAEPHLERRTVDGDEVAVLDTDAYTHGYEFPPVEVLLAELADRTGVGTIIGVDEDRALVRSDRAVDMRAVGERVAEAVPEGGVETRGGRDGELAFLVGEREAVIEAAVDAVAEQL